MREKEREKEREREGEREREREKGKSEPPLLLHLLHHLHHQYQAAAKSKHLYIILSSPPSPPHSPQGRADKWFPAALLHQLLAPPLLRITWDTLMHLIT